MDGPYHFSNLDLILFSQDSRLGLVSYLHTDSNPKTIAVFY